jgi:nitrate reductase / nitrite oxidoreductase, alpha subunit
VAPSQAKQGTDAAFAMVMGHVILREFFLDRTVPCFQDYCRRYTDMPMLVRLSKSFLKKVGKKFSARAT